MTTDVTTNPFLSDGFAPVRDEHHITDLSVTGSLPPELDGRFLRIGPNPIDPDPASYHWFTGAGMVHGIRLGDGRAQWYRNRWVRSPDVRRRLGEPVSTPTDHADDDWSPNTNLAVLGGRLHAVMEGGPIPYALTDDLETVGPSDLDGTLRHAFSGHPKLDPRTGETHAVAYWWGWGNQVAHLVIDPDGHVRSQRMIDTASSPMIHDMALTTRYALVLDLPVAFDLDSAMAGDPFPYHWQPELPSRVGLVPRAGGDVRWVEIDPCYVFHTLGAYDDGDGVVLDAVRWPRVFDGRSTGPDAGSATSLWRYHLDPATGRSSTTVLDDRPLEFPRIDERFLGAPYRFGFSAVQLPGGATGVARHDLVAGSREVHAFSPGAGVNEAVFVPRHVGAAEGDGWLLCLAGDARRGTTDLYVLDAGSPADEPVAIVHLPVRVPFGFHAAWIPDAVPA